MGGDAYDVVVIGGGPAGSMAARSSAEKGAKVLLLERDSHIGLPVRCGEAVSLKTLSRFLEIDPSWIVAEINKIVIYAPDGTAVSGGSEEQIGLILERAIFDRYLAES